MKSTRRDFFGIGAAIAAIAVGANRVVAAPAIPAELPPQMPQSLYAAPQGDYTVGVDVAVSEKPAFEWKSWPLETENGLVMSSMWLYMANTDPVKVWIEHPDGMIKLVILPINSSKPAYPDRFRIGIPVHRYTLLPVDGLRGPVKLTLKSEGKVFGLGDTAMLDKGYTKMEVKAGGMVAYSLRREKALERKNQFQYPLPPIKDEYLSGGDALNRGDCMDTTCRYFNPRDPNCFVDGVAPNLPKLPAWATREEFKRLERRTLGREFRIVSCPDLDKIGDYNEDFVRRSKCDNKVEV